MNGESVNSYSREMEEGWKKGVTEPVLSLLAVDS